VTLVLSRLRNGDAQFGDPRTVKGTRADDVRRPSACECRSNALASGNDQPAGLLATSMTRWSAAAWQVQANFESIIFCPEPSA